MAVDKTGEKEKSQEDTLLKAVSEGRAFNIGNDGKVVTPGVAVDADQIRRLVAGREQEAGKACLPASYGIVIHGATIEGRVTLDNVVALNGGPIAALEFRNCALTQGFSGAHGKFSRLCFFDCTFGPPVPESRNDRPIPTLDLTDAHVDGDLNLEGVAPEGLKPEPESEEEEEEEPERADPPYLWIRAVGARINGKVELSRCRLRAPPPREKTPTCDEREDALNLSLATIRGDIWMLCGALFEGRVSLRAAHIDGDIWMSGARIENPDGRALFMQGMRVDGLLMMDGRFDKVGNQGRFHRFRCLGEISLEEAEIGRSLYLRDAVLRGKLHAPALSVGNDLVLDGEVAGEVKLESCRIGGSLDISRLNLASSARCLNLKDGTIGRSLKLAYGPSGYKLVKARKVALKSLPGLELIETLWQMQKGDEIMTDKDVDEDRRLVQAAFLVGLGGGRLAETLHLDGHADVLKGAAARERIIDRSTAAEYGRLYGAHVLGPRGALRLLGCPPFPELSHERARARISKLDVAFLTASPVDEQLGGIARTDPMFVFEAAGVLDDRLSRWRIAVGPAGQVDISPVEGAKPLSLERVPRFRNGLIALPPHPEGESNEIVRRADWLVGPALNGMTCYDCPPKLEERLAYHIEWNPLLQAEVDLEGLRCDMLDDHGGRAWGEHLDQIKMNHFVYRRTTWESDDRRKKSSGRRLWDWVKGARADYLWLQKPGRLTRGFREECDYLEPWQVRRNWIYRLFDLSKADDLISISRYRIPEEEYRSQPFEQAIAVARAEGREDHAIRFEMLKSRIEWRILNDRARWWLGPIAITASSAWLFRNGDWRILTVVACAATLVMMFFVSRINDRLKEGASWWRQVVRLTGIYLAIVVALSLAGLALLLALFLIRSDLANVLASGLLALPWALMLALVLTPPLVLTLAVRRLRIWGGRGISAWWARRIVREVIFYLPALVLVAAEWWRRPFHYLIAFLIYVGIRSAGVLADRIMRFGFGYLRRPGRAVVALIVAFFIGWWGVHHAVDRDMVVIDAEAIADLAGQDRNAVHADSGEASLLMGSWSVDGSPYFVRELSCEHEMSEWLYALDVLLPLVDLNEESRCDVRRIADRRRRAVVPDRLRGIELWQAIPRLPLDDHHFWWWMKAIYSIIGWILVSLAILTFAQVNKIHAEPPHEHK